MCKIAGGSKWDLSHWLVYYNHAKWTVPCNRALLSVRIKYEHYSSTVSVHGYLEVASKTVVWCDTRVITL